jgi:uncharacterized protein YyaL (SSP411 family)
LTRRFFLRSGSLSAAALPALYSLPAHAATPVVPVTPFGKQADLLETARSTAAWIDSARRDDARGAWWLPDPARPEQERTVSAPNTIYSGSAGIVLFLLQLADATGDSSYRETAQRGADYLAATWRDAPPKARDGSGLDLSLYNGLAGTAFVLKQSADATGNRKHLEAARSVNDAIVEAARPAGAGVDWSGTPSIGGDGSTVLHLLQAARAFNEPRYLETARKAGDHILELAVDDPSGGLSWRKTPVFPGLPKEAYLPNFEMGTAGVSYVLARLYRETRDEKYLAAARQGALHLTRIAAVNGDAALIPYRFPDLPDLYYLGFCHGPAGTARTFFELHDITGESEYRVWTDRLARGVTSSGIPENQTPGFWNVACQCCGSAAEVELFVGLWAATGRTEHLDFAQRVARHLVGHGSNIDGKGARWYQAWTRVKPWEVSAETGYSIGAAGIGSALVHAHLASEGRYRAILLPDNPFPDRRTA